MVLLRRELGDVLRDVRLAQGKTLREVSAQARVSLGYLSEIERGQKEASSELLSSVCDALDVPLWSLLREVSDRIAVAEGAGIPDTVPVELEASVRRRSPLAGVARPLRSACTNGPLLRGRPVRRLRVFALGL